MALPVLLAVDDDPGVLDAVRTQLVQRYGHHYRIECLADEEQARRLLDELAGAGDELALVLVGLPASPAGSGDLIDEVRRLHPHAKRALLISSGAWVDVAGAEAVRASMALGRIDHYVLSPSAPPDEVFHEAVSSFLLEWARDRRLVPQTVHIVGREWSGRASDLRDVFEQCAVPHVFSLADSDKGRELLARAGDEARLPLMALPDGRILSDPSDAEIADAAGAPVGFEARTFDVVIVGAGPAGLSAAVYTASEGLDVLVIDAAGIGGQARSSALIRNYLGFAKGISGSRLAEQAYTQASVFGADFVFLHRVSALERSGDLFSLSFTDGRTVHARSVILATGATYRRLGIASLEELAGTGVFYGGPASEAPALTGRDVYVVGGGNSAGQAALHLGRYARRVTLVARAPSLAAGMSDYLVRAVGAAPNVDVRTSTMIVDGGGNGRLEHLVLRRNDTGREETVAADALFALIGARPQTDWLPADLARDEHGFVLTGDDVTGAWPLQRRPFSLETSIPHVLAAGDVRLGSVKRVAAAVGEGAIAAQLVHRVLADEQDLPSARAAGAGVA